MSEQERYLAWQTFEAGLYAIAEQVDDEEDIDTIVGVSRGGLPGAVMLSHMLDSTVETIDATHYDDRDRRNDVEIGTVDMPESDAVLIFDDIVDSGKTMAAVLEQVKLATAAPISTASMFVGPDRKHEPDYWIEETDEWIVFPWEVNL